MKSIVIASAMALFVNSVLFGQDTIRVAAWNAESLGSPYSRDYPNERPTHGFGVARQPDKVAELLKSLNADVIALSEVNDNDDDEDKVSNTILTAAFEILNQGGNNDWKYELFAKRKRYSGNQLTGLAWNRAKVKPTTRRLRIPVADITRPFNEWDRHLHAMQFRRSDGKTDFIVIPMHMKAGRGDEDQEQRENEARSLITEFPEIIAHFKGDKDIIVIGDLNMINKNEAAGSVFRGNGKMFDLNYGDEKTHVTGRPLDRCYIPKSQREDGKEFEGLRSIEIIEPQNQSTYRKELSDHWPIVIEFKNMADDD